MPVEAGFSAPVQTGPGAHLDSSTMGMVSVPGIKRSCSFETVVRFDHCRMYLAGMFSDFEMRCRDSQICFRALQDLKLVKKCEHIRPQVCFEMTSLASLIKSNYFPLFSEECKYSTF
jgi:hypothetical protein